MDEIEKEKQAALEAEKQKAIDEATAELKKNLEEKEAELKKFQDKDYNFSKVRKGEEEKEKEIADLKKQIEDVNTRITGEHKTDLLRVLAGDDEDLKKTIEHHYDRIKDDATTKEQIEGKMREAYLLATKGQVSNDVIRRQASAASGGTGKVNVGEVDPEVKDWAEEFSRRGGIQITDEDLKNFKK